MVHTKVAVGTIAESNSSACSADLLHGNDMIHVTHPRTSKVRVSSDPQKAHVAQFPPKVFAVWEVICFVDCICMRCQFLLKLKVKIISSISVDCFRTCQMKARLYDFIYKTSYLLTKIEDGLPELDLLFSESIDTVIDGIVGQAPLLRGE